MKKSSLLVLVVAALVVGLGLVYLFQDDSASVSPSGTSFSTAQIASKTFYPLTDTATSTAFLNTDEQERFVESGFSYCTGVGASTGDSRLLTLRAATSSTASASANTNYALNVTIATSTTVTANASSTYGNPIYQLWPSGSYLVFSAGATNTAACIIGVHYVKS